GRGEGAARGRPSGFAAARVGGMRLGVGGRRNDRRDPRWPGRSSGTCWPGARTHGGARLPADAPTRARGRSRAPTTARHEAVRSRGWFGRPGYRTPNGYASAVPTAHSQAALCRRDSAAIVAYSATAVLHPMLVLGLSA